MRGDATDNIPGVAGIGDKGAQKLLLEFGSVEALLDNLDKVPQKQRDLLEPLRDQVLLAKRLTDDRHRSARRARPGTGCACASCVGPK